MTFHDHKTWVLEKILVFTIYGHGNCLCHLSWIIFIHFPLSYIVRAPAIRKMVIGGRKVAQISFIPSCRGTHWKLENQCLVNFKSCKSVEIMGCILLHMTFYNVILENEGVHTKLVISLLLLILHHRTWSHFKA